ncbi:CHAT domain-containing protein [Parasphingopyxis marina]|uniref:CHAT domain-containing protein n=1 Tax=Parasphingopyxis marina TaxID=2761622 RepID=A0A842I028_9SPHN|nr:CHAT domain-containing protein [Parasphingopyxis marina]MBC2778033.1 CHAT domain-containing protein [Parasphingopyxis marina]
MRWFDGVKAVAVAMALTAAAAAPAQQLRPSLEDSFRLGSGTGLLCRVQSRLTDPAMATMFDRAYAIVCRDAAEPVGYIYALRTGTDAEARLAGLRQAKVECGATRAAVTIADIGSVGKWDCGLRAAEVAYTVYAHSSGDTLYVAEGLTGYDSALQLGLRTIYTDTMLPGELSIATTGMGDEAAFARVQAGTLDTDQALAEGYRRNNSGNYAEAAEFFETLLQRNAENGGANSNERAGEYLINQALQQSNLGDFETADATYARALAIPSASPTQLRLRRNFQALHLLNQQRPEEALAILDDGLAALMTPGAEAEDAAITSDTSQQINSGSEFARQLGGEESERLTVTERAIILDAQARQLRGAILRIQGRTDEARTALSRSLTEIATVRDGRVRSTARLRAQALTELAEIDEAEGSFASAEARLQLAVSLLEAQYPLSIASSAAKARLAAYYARRGATDTALGLFAQVVAENRGRATPRTSLENQLSPYFELMLDEMPTNPGLAADFFLATETLVRPGVANTQAVLARELSNGNDEAARLFRQSVTLTRAIETARIELARLRGIEQPTSLTFQRIAALETELAELTEGQAATTAQLAGFPRYQAVSTAALTLEDLQASLQPGEAYVKLSQVAGQVYVIFVTQDSVLPYRPDLDADILDGRVTLLRETISFVDNGQRLTFPFDVRQAFDLFTELLGPVAGRMAGVDHLIVEPDGGMLRLPANLLVTDEAGVAAYERRVEAGGDPFDFTGVAWLGRDHAISTAISARGFRDIRNLPPSSASRAYLGFGENSRPRARLQRANAELSSSYSHCTWPLEFWRSPIAASELQTVRRLIGSDPSSVVTGDAFTDMAVMQRGDLNDFRILHFATHGLITPARRDCPPQPALLTSFGDSDSSDGLLEFAEIFDLKLDADLVILSACDTASAAGIAASRAAGVTGGGSALDGLVRAFVGAGSRVVIASHWPAPDDYDATERLITGLFRSGQDVSLGEAMRNAQRGLMDDPATSHPYYWSGFAVIGDGTQPVTRAN